MVAGQLRFCAWESKMSVRKRQWKNKDGKVQIAYDADVTVKLPPTARAGGSSEAFARATRRRSTSGSYTRPSSTERLVRR
jgi:hypothetical protein